MAGLLQGLLVETAWGVDAELKQARRLFVAGKYGEVIQVLGKLAEADSISGDMHRLLGHAYLKLEKHTQAREAFVDAVSKGYWASDVFGSLAYIDNLENRELNVMVSLELASVLDPGNSNYLLVLADQAVAVRRFQFAHAVYSQLSRSHPEVAGIHLKVGDLYLKENDYRRAMLSFQNAFHLGHQTNLNIRNIAELQVRVGDYQEAIRWYEKLMSTENEAPHEILLRQAQLWFKLGDLDAARQGALDALEEKGGGQSSAAHLLLGHVALQEDKLELAVFHWEKALGDPAFNGNIGVMVGRYYLSQGRYEKAIPYLRIATQVNRPGAGDLRDLIGGFLGTNDIESAVSALKRYVENYGLDEYAQDLARQVLLVEAGHAEAAGSP